MLIFKCLQADRFCLQNSSARHCMFHAGRMVRSEFNLFPQVLYLVFFVRQNVKNKRCRSSWPRHRTTIIDKVMY